MIIWVPAVIAFHLRLDKRFFPGNLWLAYQLTGDESLRESAVKFTNYLYPLREYKGTHDIGFMMNCSYGNANRLSPADSVRSALIQTADNLCGRFNPEIGCIRSWNFGKWNFPVIIDNMMNLDLLFYATRLTGDDKYKELALTHARTTMKNHFRDDYSSYHVVSYNNDGTVEKSARIRERVTHRHGRADKHGDYMATHPVIASLRMCNFCGRPKI